MRSVGIDIGTSQVKIVEIQTTSKGFQLVQAQTKNLSRATGTDLELEVIEFLREACAKYDPLTTRFCVALRQDKVAIRNKTFPFADRLRIQKTLPFELEEDLPFSADNAVFDGKIIRIHGSSSEVLAAAAPKQHVAHLLQLMKDSNIDPFLVSTEGTAFANLLEHWNEPLPQTPAAPPVLEEGSERPARPIHLVLNIGHSRTLVCAFEGSSLVGVRSVLWGGRNLADAIAKKYNLPPLEAQKELDLKGFILTTRQEASYEAKIFSDLIAKGVRELVRDLQLSMLEFKSEFGGAITQVQMTGGSSGIQGLAPFLTQHLEVPVNKMPVLDLFPHVLFEKTDQAQLRYGVAIGLAIEGLRKPRNPAINFMKGEFAKQSSFVKDLWKDYGVYVRTAVAASVLIAIWAYTRGEVALGLEEASNETLRTQARAVAKLPSRQANEAGVKRYIRDNRKKIAEIRTLESLAGMNSAMDVLAKVSSSLPDGKVAKIDITEFSVVDQQVRLAGFVAGGRDSVETIQRSLANVAADGRVTVDGMNPAVGRMGFRMSFLADRNIQKVSR